MSAAQTQLMQYKYGDRVIHKMDGSVGSVVQMHDTDIVRIMWDGATESVPVFVSYVEPLEAASEPAPEPTPALAPVSEPVPVCEAAQTYKDRALPMAALGILCAPLQPKSKIPIHKGWQNTATTDVDTILKQDAETPDANCALVAKPDGFLFFETDEPGVIERYQQETGEPWNPTRTHESRPGRYHLVFLQTDKSRECGSITQKEIPFGSLRQNNAYILAPGSIHPITGKPYKIVDASPIIPIPDKLIEWLKAQVKKGPQAASLATGEGPIPEGFRDNTLISIGGKLRAAGLDYDEIYSALSRINQERCKPPLSHEDVVRISKSSCKYPVENQQPTVLINGEPAGTAVPAQAQPQSQPQRVLEPESEGYDHTLSPEEHEAELNKEWPVIPLKSQPGPEWSDDILYGLTGDIIRKASAYNEAHPAGMLLDLLVSLGSIFGHNPYFRHNSTIHHTNEFLARVGDSSYSRKGGGRDEIDRLLKQVDAEWYKKRTISGFGSAEAIIDQLRDSTEQSRFDTKTGTYKTVVVPGVSDKRLCIREGELASVFVLAGKADSRADIVMRDGWDCKPLKNVVKGKTKDGISLSAGCEEPHLSISGDTTRHELVSKMPDGADENGFGNRFLYVYVYRIKLCPLGGPEIDWSDETMKLYDIVQFAQQQHCVGLTASAKTTYARMYSYLENNHLPGLAGKMTSRAAPHIRRLALIYALIDKSSVVDVKHLRAAQALWNYCEDSVQFMFSGTTKAQLSLLHWMKKRQQPVSLIDVREEFYSRNKKAEYVKAIMSNLVQLGRVQQVGDTYKLIGA